MWSVVEKTALAEAEVEYEDYTSDQVWVKFPVECDANVEPSVDEDVKSSRTSSYLTDASVVIWTTTPWTLPGNRAISFSPKIDYGLYDVTDAPTDNWAKTGDTLILADKLAAEVLKQARVDELSSRLRRVRRIADWRRLTARIRCRANGGYDFAVPLLAGDHVTDDTGTGFVHTAPGHGREDFDVWTANARALEARGINTAIPYTVDENGAFTEQAPGFTGKRVITDKGEKGDANEAVIKALIEAGMLIARGRLKHQYPHSWRSKKPVIFRNTPQWFIAMDKDIPVPNGAVAEPWRHACAQRAHRAARDQGHALGAGRRREPHHRHDREPARLGDLAPARLGRADRGVRAREGRRLGRNPARTRRQQAHRRRLRAGGRRRLVRRPARASASSARRANEDWKKVDDICDVWFDSGSTHAFVLEDPVHFPALAGIRRKHDGGPDTVMYLEGSDQHRGWFHSSLLESCGTRGRAPFDVVLTHGFTLDEHGRKMSKSLGNTVAPQDVIKQSGADILRMWVCASDYADDQRIGPEILKTTVETYRKLRNTIRWMLGNLAHFHDEDRIAPEKMPELERLMLHRLAELDALVRKAYADFDYKRIFAALNAFHDHRPVGVLFRHPQGRALLRSDLLARRARPASPCSTTCSAAP